MQYMYVIQSYYVHLPYLLLVVQSWQWYMLIILVMVSCAIFICYIQRPLPIVKTMCQIPNTVITEAWCRVMFTESRHSHVSHRERVVGPLSVDSFCQSDVNIHPVLPVVTCNIY